MSVANSLETGRTNVVGSFYKWVADNITTMSPLPAGRLSAAIPFKVKYDRVVEVADVATGPLLVVEDRGLFAGDRLDINDRVLGQDTTGAQQFGTRQQTLMEVTIWGSTRISKELDGQLRRLRDAFLRKFRLAGHVDPATNLFIVPPFTIYDCSDPALAATPHFILRDRSPNWLTESILPDSRNPELRFWRGLLRLWWVEMFT